MKDALKNKTFSYTGDINEIILFTIGKTISNSIFHLSGSRIAWSSTTIFQLSSWVDIER